LDREWTLVIRKGKKRRRTRLLDRFLQRGQTGAVAAELSRRPKASETGHQETASAALLNKKLTYSIEFFEDCFPTRDFQKQQAALKYLRQAPKSLGH